MRVRLWPGRRRRILTTTIRSGAVSSASQQPLTLSEDQRRSLVHDLRNALGGSRGLLEALLVDPTVQFDDEVRQDLRLVADGLREGMDVVEQRLADPLR